MKKTEICLHCGADYIPKRRGAQKFCSNSCRSRYWKLQQDHSKNTTLQNTEKSQLPIVSNEPQKEQMSMAGIGNAATGAALVEISKNILTSRENKAATKKDINELKALITRGRFLHVNNIPIDIHGRKPYYDVETGNVVYLF